MLSTPSDAATPLPERNSRLSSLSAERDYTTPYVAENVQMKDEKIKVRVTASGQTLDVVVLNKHLDRIQVVLGEGVHSVRCDLVPTRNGSAYVGNAMGARSSTSAAAKR